VVWCNEVLTPQSLYAAVSVGLDRDTILGVLDKLPKVRLRSTLCCPGFKFQLAIEFGLTADYGIIICFEFGGEVFTPQSLYAAVSVGLGWTLSWACWTSCQRY
jgi:hypothetical protein